MGNKASFNRTASSYVPKQPKKWCIFCHIQLKERVRKLYLTGVYKTVLIEDHQLYCPRCGWWVDDYWVVIGESMEQKRLDAYVERQP